ncbi:MAG: type II secretion system F family protein, partial [Bdellovibrionales bacterium]|nr:type II secretion system F family protein [Bdellovibrionales bacterium]
SLKFNIIVAFLSLVSGPFLMGFLLNRAVERRFKAFDQDYPQFLLSLVGLLKTGMNAMAALEAAANGLEQGSLVRSEVEIMMERLRFGVSEDRSIGSFGEDIYHPEIELFVQALLLSRRVGGTLSDTLERLAKQVRKRQYFRMAAQAAVGMQRGSIWFIIAILCALEAYLYVAYPRAVTDAINDDVGWVVWQFGL